MADRIFLCRIAVALLGLSSAAACGSVHAGCRTLQQRIAEPDLATVGLTAQQLERLNALLCAKATEDAAPAPVRAREGGHLIGLDVAEIHTRLTTTIEGWEPGTEFRLENGQVWKVLKGRFRLPRELIRPEVRLVPGVAGRWFLEINPDAPKARVYRID